jgi:hypothetical protein
VSINWSNIGSQVSGITTALTAAGVSSSSFGSILGAIGLSQNPNESAELAICQSILLAAANPALVSALAMKLATEQGIPQDAAALAMTLGQPGVNMPQVVLEIEQLIKQGG